MHLSYQDTILMCIKRWWIYQLLEYVLPNILIIPHQLLWKQKWIDFERFQQTHKNIKWYAHNIANVDIFIFGWDGGVVCALG